MRREIAIEVVELLARDRIDRAGERQVLAVADARISTVDGSKSGACFWTTVTIACAKPSA
jgi:hypothetical protein